MSTELFRKESLDKITSPEQMRDYMRVTSPKLWMLLVSLIVLLVGFLIFASTTRMETTVDMKAEASSYGTLSGSIFETQNDLIEIGMPVRVAGRTGEVTDIMKLSYLKLDLRFDSGIELEDGEYYLTLEDAESEGKEEWENQYYLVVDKGRYYCGYSQTTVDAFSRDRRVRINGNLGTVTGSELATGTMYYITLTDNGEDLPEGIYQMQVVTESTTPLSFLMN